MLGSLTVLPALLSKLGDSVDRLRVPLVGRLRRDDGEGRIWGAIVDRVLRRPLLSAVIAGGLLLALAVPALQLRMATPGPDTFPKSLDVVKTYNRMQHAFPGTALPANVVVKAADVQRAGRSPGDRPAQAARSRQRPRARADHGRHEQGRDDREHHGSDPRQGNRRPVERQPGRPARGRASQDRRCAPERPGGRHRAHGRVEGRKGPAQIEAAAGGRVRPAVRVCADAGRVPLDRGRDQGDRAQPALGRRRLRRPGARLPARHR